MVGRIPRMADQSTPDVPGELRGQVRFYLLDHRTWLGKFIDIALLVLNLGFVAIFVAQTYPLSELAIDWLWRLEIWIAVVFGVEYVLRLYGAEDRFVEFRDPYTMVDLLSVLPTFALLLVPTAGIVEGVAFFRVLRVIRVLRFFRFTRDEEFFFGTVSGETLRAGKLFLTVLVIFFLTAGMFYTAEYRVNPGIETFGDAFYYIVISLTTVGFGDILPTTKLGRWVTIVGVLGAIILVPWQAGKIVREWAARDRVDVTCPNCGLSAHDPDASHCKACGHVIYQEYSSSDEATRLR